MVGSTHIRAATDATGADWKSVAEEQTGELAMDGRGAWVVAAGAGEVRILFSAGWDGTSTLEHFPLRGSGGARCTVVVHGDQESDSTGARDGQFWGVFVLFRTAEVV